MIDKCVDDLNLIFVLNGNWFIIISEYVTAYTCIFAAYAFNTIQLNVPKFPHMHIAHTHIHTQTHIPICIDIYRQSSLFFSSKFTFPISVCMMMWTLRRAAHKNLYHQCTQTYVDWGTTHTHTHTHMYSMLNMQNSRHQIPHRGAAPSPFQSTLCPHLYINDELVADQRKLIKMFWASINYSQSILLFYAQWTFTSGSQRAAHVWVLARDHQARKTAAEHYFIELKKMFC